MSRLASLFLLLLFTLPAFAAPYILPTPPLIGIGASIGFNDTGKEICLLDILPDSPAASAGLVPKSRVTRIDGVSTEGLSIGECITKIRGAEGTKVKLELMVPGSTQTHIVELVRQRLKKK